MDYLTEQLIAIKKFLARLLELMGSDIREIRDAIQEQSKTARDAYNAHFDQNVPRPTPVVVVESIETRKSAIDNKNDSTYQCKNLFWERWTFLALVIYAGIAAFQWWEMKKSVKKMDEAIAAANRSAGAAETANLNAIKSERPWLGVTSFQPHTLEPGASAAVSLNITNGGKRPALIVRSEMSWRTYKYFPEKPSYSKPLTKPSHTLLVQNTAITMTMPDNIVLTKEQLTVMDRNGWHLYVYGHTEYIDVGTKEPHTTLFCEYYIPGAKIFATCPFYNEAN